MHELTYSKSIYAADCIHYTCYLSIIYKKYFPLRVAIMINNIGSIDTLASSSLVLKLINLLIDRAVLREFRIINFSAGKNSIDYL